MGAERETPFVTAFLLMLKLFNYPVPGHVGDLFSVCQRMSNALYLASYSLDMIMDHNPRSYNSASGGGGVDGRNTYDFIIVGGGTAGSLLAARLVDHKHRYKVLVLEAGAEPTFLTHSPFFNVFNWNNNATTWGYYSIPQTDACIACRRKRVKYMQGKVLGGTTNMGFNVYSRGNPRDYDAWVNATGDDSWSYENLIKFFKKTENYRGKFDDSSTHGFSQTGTLKINTQGIQPLVKEWVDAAVSYKLNSSDPNDFQTQTFAPVEVLVYDGRRQNTYDNLLKKEIWRKNLKITRYATVTKIVIDSRGYARGVIYRRNHQDIEVHANKEVILCAGAFNTPKLLMLSGVGPTQHLRDMGIKVKKAMEHVGLNLQDKPSTFFGPVTVVHDKTFLPHRNLTYSTILEYFVNQSGLLGWNMMSGVGYYSTPSSKEPLIPNIQLTLLPMGIDKDTHKIVSTAYDLKHGYMEEFLRDHKDNDAVWASVTLARPASRGQVRLKNNDPHTHPSIDPNYFKEKEDIVNIVEGLLFAQKIFETPQWSAVDARLISTQFPGCEKFKLKTPLHYECMATHLTVSTGSVGGTCRMGKTAEDSVVDSHLLVHRVKRLRIVDASVMPQLPNGFTGTPVMVLAEKGADMILDKWLHESARHRDRSDSAGVE